MTQTRNDPNAKTLAIDPAKMLIRSVITTMEADRAGDIVIPSGLLNAEDYLLNPVVLWAHDRQRVPPIGACEWLDVQPRRVVAETRFAQDVRFAEDVFKLYEQGVLRGWSIGFLPRRVTPILNGRRIDKWELLEYSAVPIPENPGALTLALQKGYVKDAMLREWLKRVPDDRGGRTWRAFDHFENLIQPERELVHSE
jgi:hypothetical protein